VAYDIERRRGDKMSDTSLTENEKLVIQAILNSEYGDYVTDGVYSMYLSDDTGINKSSMGGIIGSLSKKGIVETYDTHMDSFGVVDIVSLTSKGAALVKSLEMKTHKLFD
jgi:DNA-binding MarR family transcriptional regulator